MILSKFTTPILALVFVLDWLAGHFGQPHDTGDGWPLTSSVLFIVWLAGLAIDLYRAPSPSSAVTFTVHGGDPKKIQTKQ